MSDHENTTTFGDRDLIVWLRDRLIRQEVIEAAKKMSDTLTGGPRSHPHSSQLVVDRLLTHESRVLDRLTALNRALRSLSKSEQTSGGSSATTIALWHLREADTLLAEWLTDNTEEVFEEESEIDEARPGPGRNRGN